MTQAQPTATNPTPAPNRRWWFLVGADALALVGLLVVWLLLPERVDRGTRVLLSFVTLVAAAIAGLVWFFAMSRLPAKVRLAGAVGLVLMAIALAVSIRRVEFSGDMAPSFDFRWTTDRDARLEAHRAQQRAATSKTAANVAAPAPVAGRAAEGDVLDYRGVDRAGVIPGPKLARDWSQSPPKLVWRQPVGGGYAGFVVVGPLVITIEQRRDREAIVAYDFDTGRELWMHDYPALFSEKLGGDGPRATPIVYGDKLYSLGATGVLACLELTTGEPVWSVNILVQNGAVNLDWGMSGSPLAYDGLVLVNPGNQKGTTASRSITTFDAAGGSSLWSAGESKAGYASPMLVMLGGQKQVLLFDGVGLAGCDAADGRELWRTEWKSDFDINAAQPVVLDGDRVFITSASGAAVFHIEHSGDAWKATELWRNRKMKASYSCPIAYQESIYGIDENLLACLDLASGKLLWKSRDGQFGHGQMLRRDDLLLVLGEAGELALVEATPERYHELGRIQAIDGKTWNNPALVGGRVFVRNHLEMAAYDLPLAE